MKSEKGQAREARKRNPQWAAVLKNKYASKRTLKRRAERERQYSRQWSGDPYETDWEPGEAS